MIASFKGHSDITKNYSVRRNHAWCTITSLISVFFILVFSPSPSLGFSPESEMEMMSLSTTIDNQKNEEQQQEYRVVPVAGQIPEQGDRPVKFGENCKHFYYANDYVGYICAEVFDNPTEAFVSVNIEGKSQYNGPFPLGEDGKKVFQGDIGGKERTLWLYVILEPNNNYVAYQVLDVCPPEEPTCNIRQVSRLFTLTPPSEPTPEAENKSNSKPIPTLTPIEVGQVYDAVITKVDQMDIGRTHILATIPEYEKTLKETTGYTDFLISIGEETPGQNTTRVVGENVKVKITAAEFPNRAAGEIVK
jgi:hypothetical protein